MMEKQLNAVMTSIKKRRMERTATVKDVPSISLIYLPERKNVSNIVTNDLPDDRS